LDYPAAVAVFDEGSGGGLDGGVFGDLGEGTAGFGSGGPAGDAFNLVLIGDGVLRRVSGVVGDCAADGGDIKVSEAEVAVARPVGIGCPDAVTFVGEVVEVDLLGANEEALLLFGGAGEETGVSERIEVASAVVFGRVGFGGHFDGLGPEALVLTGVGVVDRGFELGRVEFFFAGGRQKSESGKSDQGCNVSAHS